jgi:ribokinase
MVKYASRLNLIVKSTTNKNTITLLKQLVNQYQLMALVTLGDQGSQIFTHEKDYFVPAIKTKATDTTGAGDAYLATFLVKYMETKNIPLAMETATEVARQKVTRYGASS